MRISHDVRAYAEDHGLTSVAAIEAGTAEKPEEFASRGSRVYLPVPGADPHPPAAGTSKISGRPRAVVRAALHARDGDVYAGGASEEVGRELDAEQSSVGCGVHGHDRFGMLLAGEQCRPQQRPRVHGRVPAGAPSHRQPHPGWRDIWNPLELFALQEPRRPRPERDDCRSAVVPHER